MPLSLDMKILIVDDSGTMRLMFKQMLKEFGFNNFIMADNGKDAIRKLNGNIVDLIISDWNMPEMDGLEFLQWIRKDISFNKIPFIMATAQSDKSQQQIVFANGGDSHIAKPFDSFELKATIDESFGLETKEQKRAKNEKVDGKVKIRAGHIQITDHLALGVLRKLIDTGEFKPEHFELETECMPGWNPVQNAIENNQVDVAFVLAPIAMDLFAFDTKIKLVSLAHKNGSTFVRNKQYVPEYYDNIDKYYQYKEVDIPHKMSIHHILAYKYLNEIGLKPGVPGQKGINVRFEVMPPIKMPEIMNSDEQVGGFMVAEPIGSNAINKKIGDLQFKSSDMWPGHPCCIVVMQEDFINNHLDAAYEFVDMLIKAGQFIDEQKERAARIGVDFLDPDKKIGLTDQILTNVLNDEGGIIMNDMYPVLEDLDMMQHYMHEEMKIGKIIDLDEFADLRFVNAAMGQ